MKLKLKRATRTPYSEEILLYDLDSLDSEGLAPSFGKLDVHYVDDQIVGTLLISESFALAYRQPGGNDGQVALDGLLNQILSEVSEPIGVSATYAIEVYYPSFASQGFYSNYEDDRAEIGASRSGAQYHPDSDPAPQVSRTDLIPPPPREDDFAARLRQP